MQRFQGLGLWFFPFQRSGPSNITIWELVNTPYFLPYTLYLKKKYYYTLIDLDFFSISRLYRKLNFRNTFLSKTEASGI